MTTSIETIEYLGLQCVEFEAGDLRLLVTQSVGPRIISLEIGSSGNLFAELPDLTLEYPGQGEFHLYGGHRLWIAPEEPKFTYRPDDDPVEIASTENGLRVVQPVDPARGLQKSLEIRARETSLEVDHILHNTGSETVECAPWAITQLAPGGYGYLPLTAELAGGSPFLPNRSIVMWPYMQVETPYIEWFNDLIMVTAHGVENALKVGVPNPVGWIAYWRDDNLFVKQAVYDAADDYFDLGASSQCYANADFLELETLGPKTELQPGSTISHRETWLVYAGVPQPQNRQELENILAAK